MIQDVADVDAFLQTDGVALLSLDIAASAEKVSGVVFRHGHLAVTENLALPFVQKKASTRLFSDVNPSHYADLLKAQPQENGRLARTLFVQGTPNYYHFLVYTCPALLLLRAFNAAVPLSLTMVHDVPKSAARLMASILPVFSQGRDVEIRRIGNGTYALSDVIFPIRPVTSLIAHVSRNLILPFVLNEMAVADPVRQLGPLKLFVRREFAANGRNLSNQAEVERWFVDK